MQVFPRDRSSPRLIFINSPSTLKMYFTLRKYQELVFYPDSTAVSLYVLKTYPKHEKSIPYVKPDKIFMLFHLQGNVEEEEQMRFLGNIDAEQNSVKLKECLERN